MNVPNRNITLVIVAVCLSSCSTLPVAYPQEEASLPLDMFDDADTWPTFRPGEIAVNGNELSNLKVAYRADFLIPDGTMQLTNYIDVMNVMFDGKPANWMQWTFTSEDQSSNATANLDLLIMDRETGALRFRLLPSAPGSDWGGPYNMIGASDDQIRRIVLSDDEPPLSEMLTVGGPVFDFGGLPFVFPFMELETGDAFRLQAYQQSGANGVQLLDVRVIGETEISDEAGRLHRALEIQTLAPSRTSLIQFFVTDKPPYFYGYDYKSVETGESLFKMTYRGFVHTEIE